MTDRITVEIAGGVCHLQVVHANANAFRNQPKRTKAPVTDVHTDQSNLLPVCLNFPAAQRNPVTIPPLLFAEACVIVVHTIADAMINARAMNIAYSPEKAGNR